ncbi:MAG: hypothetical protein H6998_18935 [Hahellaceae bacterium]|nr:hypothetical protein [Hahellaceae bacterium]
MPNIQDSLINKIAEAKAIFEAEEFSFDGLEWRKYPAKAVFTKYSEDPKRKEKYSFKFKVLFGNDLENTTYIDIRFQAEPFSKEGHHDFDPYAKIYAVSADGKGDEITTCHISDERANDDVVVIFRQLIASSLRHKTRACCHFT